MNWTIGNIFRNYFCSADGDSLVSDIVSRSAIRLRFPSKGIYRMPASLTCAFDDAGHLEDPAYWGLPNQLVRDFMDYQNTDDADRPWGLWGRLTGISSAYNRDVRDSVARRAVQVPSMGLLPCRLYSPSRGSYLVDTHTQANSSAQSGKSNTCPDYVVISYTWGCWVLESRKQDTVVPGANWLAPANSLFTRDDLDLAVRKIAGESSVWLDVFCIPQSDIDHEKAIEIGKQGSIFRSASRAVTVAEVCSWVPEVVEMVSVDVFPLPSAYMIHSQRRPEQRVPETWRRMKIVADFTKSVPWASSLWTLQESALRPDAVFHSKLGDPLLNPRSGVPITIKHLRTTMSTIRNQILNFIDLMHERDHLSPLEKPELWGPSEQDDWYLSSSDISLVFEALQTVNTVAVHNLGTMNAGELLLASKQRTASTARDRVYGIMGAIGVPLTVNYQSDPDQVFDDFILQLHNEVPVEIQAFYRPHLFRPSQRQWMMDEDVSVLSLLQQKEAPERPDFTSITPEGWLVAAQIEPIASRGLGHLIGRILSNRALIAADRKAFRSVCGGVQFKEVGESGASVLLAHLAHLLRLIASKTQLALVYLGTVSGIEQRGWRTAYLLLARLMPDQESGASSTEVEISQHFQRLGLVIAMERFSFNNVLEDKFVIR